MASIWLVLMAAGIAAASLVALWRERRRAGALMRWAAGPMAGELPALPGPLGDVAERVRRVLRDRDEQLAERDRRLDHVLSIMEALPHGVLLLDAHGQIRWMNRTAAQHFGLDVVRDLAQRVTHLVRTPAFVAWLQAGPPPEPVVIPSPRDDTTLAVLARPFDGAMTLLLSQDITERERHDRMRRDFVANVSHEIRSPLTVLAGFIETVANLPLTGAERQRVIALMRQQTTRMQNLVTDLLALAQIEGAPRPLTDAWIAIDELLAQIDIHARAGDRDRHRIEIRSDAAATQISGIESELFSACWNLVGNALRYTPEGGSVTVTWSVRGDGCGEFRVTDTGVGIAREHIPRLTERFYRVDGSRSRETGGTGLGLAIVKHVAQRHGGELQIDSVPGKGSVFRLVLPALRVRTTPVPVVDEGQALTG
jgi:two-component system phosphate regulon sensor histidine kinase PhoR